MPKVAIIYNPKAGHQSASQHIALKKLHLYRYLGIGSWEETQAPGHATSLANVLKKDAELIIAIGGDGTVNEVGAGLLGTETALGIIPAGSGNGLANELRLTRHPRKAAHIMAQNKTAYIDTLEVNGHPAFNIAGIGFDALVAQEFANMSKRGFWNYIKATLAAYWRYRPLYLDLYVDGLKITGNFFLIAFANSRQYGNNAYIAPQACIDDEFIDVGLLKPFPWYHAPALITRLFAGTIHRSRFYQALKAKEISIVNSESLLMHLDGEIRPMAGPVLIRLHPHKLKVITGHRH